MTAILSTEKLKWSVETLAVVSPEEWARIIEALRQAAERIEAASPPPISE